MTLKEKLKTLPHKPGCYLMKNKEGTIIYVGKAVNLFNRVNSYFVGAHDYKTTKLVSNIADFDFIVVNNEKESLILEYNLIKQHDPYFNIVFKDDKSYPYILLKDTKEPAIAVVRLKKKKNYKGKLFGPYPDVKAARMLHKTIQKLYPIQKCEKLGKDLCLYYHIGECLGYCKKTPAPEVIADYKKKIVQILNGDTAFIISDLQAKMLQASTELNFEKAKEYRDLINDINTTTLKQAVQLNRKESFDVFAYWVEDGYIAITGLFIRDGKLLGSDKYLDYLVGDAENFFSSYLYQFYQINPQPKQLLVSKNILAYLQQAFDFPVVYVSRGSKRQLIEQAELNCRENIAQNRRIITGKQQYNDEIQNELNRIFGKEIQRIELFDNSHTAGKETVAAMVVYKDLKPAKAEYRLYKLNDGADDLQSMQEVLYRRYFRVLKDDLERPDLIIVDGAATQINAAKAILKELDLDICLAGLGKDNHHNTSYLMDAKLNTIAIKKDSNLFFFLTNMQDEVHRFAINYHKKLRTKAMYRSVLDGVSGLGPKTRVKLLKKYKSIAALKELTLAELETELQKNVALRLYNKLREEVVDAEEFK